MKFSDFRNRAVPRPRVGPLSRRPALSTARRPIALALLCAALGTPGLAVSGEFGGHQDDENYDTPFYYYQRTGVGSFTTCRVDGDSETRGPGVPLSILAPPFDYAAAFPAPTLTPCGEDILFSLVNAGNIDGFDYEDGRPLVTAGIIGHADGRLEIIGSNIRFDTGSLSFDGDLDMHGYKIINLAPGDIGPTSKDAINGSQLYELMTQNTKYFVANSTQPDSTPTGADSIAAGPVALASGQQTIALGQQSKSTSKDAIAIGSASVAIAQGSVALGAGSKATRANTVSIGGVNSERQIANVAAGTAGTDAVNLDQLNAAIAGGNTPPDAVVYDTSAHTHVTLGGIDASTPVVLGNLANGIAGHDAVNVSQLQALGAKIDTSGNISNAFVAYDDSSRTTVTLGGKDAPAPVSLTNLAPGAVTGTSKDAINGAQLLAASTSIAQVFGGQSSVAADGSIVAPTYALNEGTYRDVGSALSALDDAIANLSPDTSILKYVKIVSVSPAAVATEAETLAIGGGAVAGAERSIAIGYGASASFANSVAIGAGSITDAEDSVSVGSATLHRRVMNVADAQAGTDVATTGQLNALRDQLSAASMLKSDGVRSMLLGAGAASQPDSLAVRYDTADRTVVTLGGAGATPVKLTNLAAGEVSAASTDAVTGAQLFAVDARVSNAETALNNFSTSGSTALAINTAVTPVRASAAASGALAFGSGATADVASGTAIGKSASATGSNSVALGADSVADRDNTVSVGNGIETRRLIHVADGTQGTDAVNVRQLTSVLGQTMNTIAPQIDAMQTQINVAQKNAYGGVAAAMSIPALTPNAAGTTLAATGAGTYMSGQATGVTATYRSQNGRWLVNGGLALTSSGTAGGRVQVGYETPLWR